MNMQHKFQQFFVHEPGCASVHSTEGWTFQLHADLGTHSAHCAADRGPSQVQFLAGCGSACCCAVTGALVGRAENCGVSAVAVVLGVVQFLDKVVVPVGTTTGAWVRNAWFDSGYMLRFTRVAYGRICTIFYVTGWARDPEVNSRRSLHTWPMRKWPRSSSIMAVAVYTGFACDAPRAVSRRLPAGPFFFCCRAALGNLYIISTTPVYFQHFSAVEILR